PASAKNISTAQIETMLNEFNTSTFDIIANMYGAPSDIDQDNKVIFLFTHLVDQVGGVAGFYSSGSLFSKDRGGDGNIADMMFISPTRESASYKSLLAHEFQHLVNFNQHVLVANGDAEETWLNEGLSHVAEDLVDGHIDGGNTDLVSDFMSAPNRYALTGDASLNSGIRGAAYLFVRGLMESFGSDVPGRLVKTNKVNIANVENLSGQSFDDAYRTFTSRLFLSGNNLNTQAALNYSFKYFTEPQTNQRSLPVPTEQKIDAQTTSVSGTVRPAASTFIRLTGTGSQNIQIQTDLSGNFYGTYIALPKSFVPALSLSVNFFQNLTLDAPFSAVYTTGQNVTFSGSVNDPSITQILLTYEPRDPSGEEIRFSVGVSGGRFNQSVIFAPSQAGEYTLAVFAGQQGGLLPQVGRFPSAIVSAGDGKVSLPTDFFSGVTLSTALPGQYQAGQGASLIGQTTDSTIEVLLLVFTSKTDGSTIRIQTSVSNGAFRKGFIFTPEQAGTYDLDLFGGPAGGSVPHLGGFSPIVVTSTGSEDINLPVDIFDNVVLSSPFNTTFIAGQTRHVSGTVSDASITQVAISFAPTAGGSAIDNFINVNKGQFGSEVSFTGTQSGQYEMILFGGQAGQSLPLLGRFTPINVVSARPAITLPTTSLAWSDVSEGETQTQALSIINSGSETLNITGFVTEAPFSTSANTLSIAPGETGTTVVIFSPTSGGTHTGTLQILSNDPDRGTQLLSLSGTAITVLRPIITLRQNALTWPTVTIGQTQDQTLTFVNTGEANLTVTAAADNAAFTLTSTTFTIAPKDSSSITVTFTPTAAGDITGTITLATNDKDNSSVQVTMTGTGGEATPTQPAFTVSLDLDSAAQNQNLSTLTTTENKSLSIQIWGDGIQSAVGFGARFEYDATQITFDKFEVGTALPGGTSPGDELGEGFVVVSAAILGGTIDTTAGLLGTLYFQTNAGFSGTDIQFKSIQLSRNNIFETLENNTSLQLALGTTAPTPDFNGDGNVGFADFLAFAGAFGSDSSSPNFDTMFDLSGDGSVGFPDFLIFAAAFGKPA
ncbi:MAG: choice-of-anchor D domain-containing protein, partial [Candidatus Latescibacteria bacterium]|nr:choice-of-anchor D domain-containing protein [Candidatus Latescibacterota bacterium]